MRHNLPVIENNKAIEIYLSITVNIKPCAVDATVSDWFCPRIINTAVNIKKPKWRRLLKQYGNYIVLQSINHCFKAAGPPTGHRHYYPINIVYICER